MNDGKVLRLERRLAQVEATAARLREAIAALRATEPPPEPKPVKKPAARKATRARKTAA